MPAWWPEDRPPEKLDPAALYRGKDGKWRHYDGVIVSRAERRRARIR